MIDYPYVVDDVLYAPPVTAGLFRPASCAILELTLVMPEWARYDDLHCAVVRLSGADASSWRKLASGDKIRVYGRPEQDRTVDARGRVLLGIRRLKRGHMNFLSSRSNTLKEASTA